MPAASKIRDLPEALSWLREGRTYQWIVDEYLRKYDVRTMVSMWGACVAGMGSNAASCAIPA